MSNILKICLMGYNANSFKFLIKSIHIWHTVFGVLMTSKKAPRSRSNILKIILWPVIQSSFIFDRKC